MHHTLTFGQACELLFFCMAALAVAAFFIYCAIRDVSGIWYSRNSPQAPHQPKPWYVRTYEFLNQ